MVNLRHLQTRIRLLEDDLLRSKSDDERNRIGKALKEMRCEEQRTRFRNYGSPN